MKIQVTQEDIDNGVRASCKFCPVASAIRRAFNNKAVVRTYNLDVSINDKLILLPLEAVDFILLFDAEVKVKPFEFELDLTNTLV